MRSVVWESPTFLSDWLSLSLGPIPEVDKLGVLHRMNFLQEREFVSLEEGQRMMEGQD